MKKLMLTVCACLSLAAVVCAQQPQVPGECGAGDARPGDCPKSAIEEQAGPDAEQLAKGIAERMMLDDETTAKFVPLYKEYMEAMAEVRSDKGCKKGEGEEKEKKELTDADIEAMFVARLEVQAKMLDLQKTYFSKFKKVLTVRQAASLLDGHKGRDGRIGREGRPNRGGLKQVGKGGPDVKGGGDRQICPSVCPPDGPQGAPKGEALQSGDKTE